MTRCDTQWLLILVKHLFFFRQKAKQGKRWAAVTGPASSTLLSSWPHRAGRARSRTWAWEDTSHKTQCKREPLANKQSAPQFISCGFLFSCYVSGWFLGSQSGLIWLIALHIQYLRQNEGQKTTWASWLNSLICVTCLSVSSLLSSLVPLCIHPSITASSLVYNPLPISPSLFLCFAKKTTYTPLP